MSKKHNTKHFRSTSHYPERLEARGESSATVRMPFIDRKGRKHGDPISAQRADLAKSD